MYLFIVYKEDGNGGYEVDSIFNSAEDALMYASCQEVLRGVPQEQILPLEKLVGKLNGGTVYIGDETYVSKTRLSTMDEDVYKRVFTIDYEYKGPSE